MTSKKKTMLPETMSTLTKETCEVLHDLIRANTDSARLLRTAAADVADAGLASLFKKIATVRESHGTELAAHLVINRDEPGEGGTFTGQMHRLWADLKAAVNGGNAKAMLDVVEKGEHRLKTRYEETFKEARGYAMNDVLTKHLAEIRKQHDDIGTLRTGWAANRDSVSEGSVPDPSPK